MQHTCNNSVTVYHSIPRINWGSFRGRFGDHFRVGDHFGVGIISGAVQTSSARKYPRLWWREEWGWGEGGGGWRRCFKHFLEYTYFLRLVKAIIRILQPFFMFFLFLTSWIFIPFLVFSLLVTRYCVTLFSNTHCKRLPSLVNRSSWL